MSDSVRDIVRNESRRQAIAVGLVVGAAALMSFAPRNERRMFTVPTLPSAMAVMEAPIPTDLTSPIMGYLYGLGGVGGPLDGFGRRGFAGPRTAGPGGRGMPSTVGPAGTGSPADPNVFFANPVTAPPVGSTPGFVTPSTGPGGIPLGSGPGSGTTPGGGGGIPGVSPLPLPELPNELTPVPPQTVTPPPLGAIPEPSSWAMMICGFGMIGAAMRSRKRALARTVY